MSELQKFFEQAVKGLLAQGVASRGHIPGYSKYNCMYRAPDGCKCAIGMCISDNAYNTIIETTTVMAVCVQDALVNSGWTLGLVCNTQFLSDLQDCHDNLSPEQWAAGFTKVGVKYGLSTEFINQEAN